MSKKDANYYKRELQKIKQQKRLYCASVPDGAYGSTKNGKMNNERIKKLKQELKVKQRSLKRSEKQQIDKMIEDEVWRWENEQE